MRKTAKCNGCGKEVDPYWSLEMNTGRGKVYLCGECQRKAEYKVKENKKLFYLKHSIKENK